MCLQLITSRFYAFVSQLRIFDVHSLFLPYPLHIPCHYQKVNLAEITPINLEFSPRTSSLDILLLPPCYPLATPLLPPCYRLASKPLPIIFLLSSLFLPSIFPLPSLFLPSSYLLPTHYFIYTKRQICLLFLHIRIILCKKVE